MLGGLSEGRDAPGVMVTYHLSVHRGGRFKRFTQSGVPVKREIVKRAPGGMG